MEEWFSFFHALVQCLNAMPAKFWCCEWLVTGPCEWLGNWSLLIPPTIYYIVGGISKDRLPYIVCMSCEAPYIVSTIYGASHDSLSLKYKWLNYLARLQSNNVEHPKYSTLSFVVSSLLIYESERHDNDLNDLSLTSNTYLIIHRNWQ